VQPERLFDRLDIRIRLVAPKPVVMGHPVLQAARQLFRRRHPHKVQLGAGIVLVEPVANIVAAPGAGIDDGGNGVIPTMKTACVVCRLGYCDPIMQRIALDSLIPCPVASMWQQHDVAVVGGRPGWRWAKGPMNWASAKRVTSPWSTRRRISSAN